MMCHRGECIPLYVNDDICNSVQLYICISVLTWCFIIILNRATPCRITIFCYLAVQRKKNVFFTIKTVCIFNNGLFRYVKPKGHTGKSSLFTPLKT